MQTEFGIDDAKRRADNALIAAMDDGIAFREILELAMDDITASEYAMTRLAGLHDTLFGDADE